MTLLINRKAAVSITVKSKANVKMILQDVIAQAFDMSRAAVNVDIESVGVIVYNLGVSAESIENALCDLPGAAVGAVKAYAVVFV